MTDADYTHFILRLAKHCEVSAHDIEARLLSSCDRADIKNGNISKRDAIFHVIAWREAGSPDYSERQLR